MTAVSDPRSLSTTYTIDGLGNVTQLASPDTGTTTNTYDAAGNLLTQTDAKSQVTSYPYDALNRVTQIAYSSGTASNFEYDGGSGGGANTKGRLTKITDEAGTTNLTYDAQGRVTQKSQILGSVTLVTQYQFNSSGRLTSLTYPSGRALGFSYDAAGRITSMTLTISGVTKTVLGDVGYHPFGSPKEWVWSTGGTYTRTVDTDGRVGSFTAGNQTIAVSYDAASRISYLSDVDVPANTNGFSYDVLDRLTGYTGPSVTQAFTYDAVGNRASKTVGANTDTYSYGSTNNRLSQITGASTRSFTHDALGSITANGTLSMTYSARGRLSSSTNGSVVTDYKYNGLGQRISKAVAGGATTLFVYDEAGRLLGEYDGSGSVVTETAYLVDIPVLVLK